nr:serine/threonine-protein kinase dst1 [Ipomoea batatas]
MDFSQTPWRSRKPPPPKLTDIYSTVGVQGNHKHKNDAAETDASDLYATVVYKGDVDVDVVDDPNDDESLPPLLKRLPKDFGGGGLIDSDSDNEAASISGTMIVKTSRSSMYSNPASPYLKPRSGPASYWERNSEFDAGTVETRTRKSGSGGASGLSTMSRAVASMQAVGEIGHARQRKSGSGWVQEEELRPQGSKVSSSSIPESVTKEDPSSKYELLHELGKFDFSLIALSFLA